MEVSGKRLDTAEEGTEEESEKLCELCEADNVETAANGICRECEEYMCNICFRHHLKGKFCREHALIDINTSSASVEGKAENVEKCRIHAKESIKYFCRKHEIVGCGDCMIPRHNDCKPENIKDLAREFEHNKDFKSITAKIENLMSANNSNERKIQESKKENTKMLEEALKDIQKFRAEINKYLDKAEANIISEVKDQERKNHELLAKLEKECETVLSEVTNVRQTLDEGLYKGNALFIQSVVCKPKIAEIERMTLQIQTENKIPMFKFIPEKHLQDTFTSIMKLGNITQSTLIVDDETSAQSETIAKPKRSDKEKIAVKKSQYRTVDREQNTKDIQQDARIFVGARVRPIGRFLDNVYNYFVFHKGQPGTVTKVYPDGKVDVNFDTGEVRLCRLGEEVALNDM